MYELTFCNNRPPHRNNCDENLSCIRVTTGDLPSNFCFAFNIYPNVNHTDGVARHARGRARALEA